LRLLVDDIVSAKDDGFRCRSTHPTALVTYFPEISLWLPRLLALVKRIYQFFQMLNARAWCEGAARLGRCPHARVNAS
jgi:hypothetical protein